MSSADETRKPRGKGQASSKGDAWIGTLDQAEFDVDFYQRILRRQPADVRVLRLLGELYARQGKYDRALEVDQRLVALEPEDDIAHYNLACSLAMRGAKTDALDCLGRAIELGYNDFSHLEVDPDLASLRPLPQYQALLRQYGLNG